MADRCRCFKFKGSLFLRPGGTGAAFTAENDPDRPWFQIGNAGQLLSELTEKETRVPNNEDCCGGDYCYATEIDSIAVTIETQCLSAKTAALGLRGDVAEVLAGAKTLPTFFITRGGLVPLGPYVDKTSLVVELTASPNTPLVLGTDYVFKGAGIYILPTSTVVPAEGANFDLEWDQTEDFLRVEMFTRCGASEYEVMLLGDNCLDPQNGGMIDYLYRLSIGGASQFSALSQDAGTLSIKGRLLADQRITSGSKFGTLSF
jgi:hypothetical protein